MTATNLPIGRAAPRAMVAHGALHLLLAVQSLVVLLVSLNRLSPLALGYVAPNEFLRWVDLNNMLALPLISLVASYLLKRRLEAGAVGHARARLALNLLFIVGVYGLGASYGNHEVTNYLHARFCAEGTAGDLCRIVAFNDDEFSHWLFFASFVMINGALLLFQALAPAGAPTRRADGALLLANALFIGLGIFANLAFEAIGLDLYVVALLAALALALLWRRGARPLFVYYAAAYTVGLGLTLLYRLAA